MPSSSCATPSVLDPPSIPWPPSLTPSLPRLQSHDPILFRMGDGLEPAPNDPGWKVRQVPDARPVLSSVGKRLAGVEAY